MHNIIRIKVDRNMETDVVMQGDEQIISLALLKVFKDISRPYIKHNTNKVIRKFLVDCSIDLGKHFDKYQTVLLKELFDEQQFRQR